MRRATKLLAAVLTLAALYLPAIATPATAGACGVWRWPVKTLSDTAKSQVNFTAIDASIARFRLRPRPSISFVTDTPRFGYVEHRTWRLRARPIQAKLEDDGDIHLVISVPNAPAKTMIVEFPRKICVASAFRRNMIAAARQAFVSNCGSVSASSWLRLAGSVTVTGVGFWDERHGQTGVAPNGIELHPVLRFTGDCHPAATGGSGGGGGGGGGGSGCTPGYSPCLPLGPSDYDCYGGGGNGPAYTQPGVTYQVTGSDPYRLDGNNNGLGCE